MPKRCFPFALLLARAVSQVVTEQGWGLRRRSLYYYRAQAELRLVVSETATTETLPTKKPRELSSVVSSCRFYTAAWHITQLLSEHQRCSLWKSTAWWKSKACQLTNEQSQVDEKVSNTPIIYHQTLCECWVGLMTLCMVCFHHFVKDQSAIESYRAIRHHAHTGRIAKIQLFSPETRKMRIFALIKLAFFSRHLIESVSSWLDRPLCCTTETAWTQCNSMHYHCLQLCHDSIMTSWQTAASGR